MTAVNLKNLKGVSPWVMGKNSVPSQPDGGGMVSGKEASTARVQSAWSKDVSTVNWTVALQNRGTAYFALRFFCQDRNRVYLSL